MSTPERPLADLIPIVAPEDSEPEPDLVPLRVRRSPDGRRFAMQAIDPLAIQRWFTVGWTGGGGWTVWSQTDEEVADWSEPTRELDVKSAAYETCFAAREDAWNQLERILVALGEDPQGYEITAVADRTERAISVLRAQVDELERLLRGVALFMGGR